MDNIVGMIAVVFCIIIVALFVTWMFGKNESEEQVVEESPKKELNQKRSFSDFLIFIFFILVMVLFFGIGLFLESAQYNNDCIYSDRGCRGDSKFGWP